MHRQLPRCRNSLRRANEVDLAKIGELFRRYRPATQDVDPVVTQGNDGRFDPVRSRTSVDNQRDASTQFIKNVLRGRGADPAKSICARRGDRFPERRNDFSKNGMRTHSHRDCVEPGDDDFRNNRLSIKHKRERPGPELRNQPFDLRTGAVVDVRHASQPLFVRKMNNQGIETRAFFRFENLGDCDGIKRVGCESIHCFGRQRDNFAFAQEFNRALCSGCR